MSECRKPCAEHTVCPGEMSLWMEGKVENPTLAEAIEWNPKYLWDIQVHRVLVAEVSRLRAELLQTQTMRDAHAQAENDNYVQFLGAKEDVKRLTAELEAQKKWSINVEETLSGARARIESQRARIEELTTERNEAARDPFGALDMWRRRAEQTEARVKEIKEAADQKIRQYQNELGRCRQSLAEKEKALAEAQGEAIENAHEAANLHAGRCQECEQEVEMREEAEKALAEKEAELKATKDWGDNWGLGQQALKNEAQLERNKAEEWARSSARRATDSEILREHAEKERDEARQVAEGLRAAMERARRWAMNRRAPKEVIEDMERAMNKPTANPAPAEKKEDHGR